MRSTIRLIGTLVVAGGLLAASNAAAEREPCPDPNGMCPQIQVSLPPQDPTTQAPITALWYRLCRASNRSDCTAKQSVPVSDPSAPTVSFSVKAPDAGDRLVDVFLQDGAGNVDESLYNDDSHVRYDPDPPRVSGFRADDPSDPTHLEADASDATSGIAAGEIDYQVVGGPATWHTLPTTVTQSGLDARLDDSQVPAGELRFRAIATDLAGNSAAGTNLAGSGQGFVLRTPLREGTRLRLSATRTLRATAKRCRRVHGRRRCRTVVVPPLHRQPTSIRLSFGRRKRLHGLITTRAGRPIAGGTVRITMLPDLAGAHPTTVTVHANSAGQLAYVIPAGPSRSIDVGYVGSAHLQPSRSRLAADTAGKVSLSASPRSIRAPGTVGLSGRVEGRPLPRNGKLVSLQAWRAHRWETFATVHTDTSGRFRYEQVIHGSPPGVYPLRAVITREAGYPYAAARSRPVRIRVG
jgi:hypothetical protein